jgi:hypothetical protein
MNAELQKRLDRVVDNTGAMLLLAEIDDPVLKHEPGGPSMQEWAEFNREAHASIRKHLGVQHARQSLLLIQKREEEFAECWSCRMLEHFLPEHVEPDPRWVGVA